MTVSAPPIPDRDRSLTRHVDAASLPAAVRVAVGLTAAGALLWPLLLLLPDAATTEAWTREVVSATWLSLAQAALAATLGVALSIPLGWALARVALPARPLLRAALTLPIVTPALGVVLGAEWLLGGAWPLLVLSNAGLGLAVGVRLGGSAWAVLGAREAEAARTLGFGVRQLVRWYYVPALRAPFIAAWALAFALAVSAYVPAYLLGPTSLPRLAASTSELAAPEAASAAWLLTVIVVLALVAFVRCRPAFRAPAGDDRPLALGALSARNRGWLAVACALGVGLSLGPLLALLHGVLTIGADGQLTGGNLAAILDAPRPSEVDAMAALRRSVVLAFSALVIVVPCGFVVAILIAPLRGWLAAVVEVALFMPFFLPVALASGLRAAGFGPSWLLFAHIGMALPLVVRVILPGARAPLRRALEATTMLGASRWTSWRWLVVPRLRAQMALAIVLAFAWSVGELGAALLLHRLEAAPGSVAIALAIQEQTARADGRAFALAALFVLLVTIGFVTIEHRRSPEITEF